MDNLSNKISYLKGLLEGAPFESDSPNAKIIPGIIDVLNDFSKRLDAMEDLVEDLNDYVESIDDDLSMLEEEIDEGNFDDDDDDDDLDDFLSDDDDEDEWDASDQLRLIFPGEEEEDDPDHLSAVLCPACGFAFAISHEHQKNNSYICPHCELPVIPKPFSVDSLKKGEFKE